MSKTKDPHQKERIYYTIRDKILSLLYMPGDKIPEAALAEELGVSRPLIREAILHLSWDGLVKLEANRPACVIEMDEKLIQDLAFVRWQHDQLAIPLAFYNISMIHLKELRELAMACIQANEEGNLSERHRLDADFHQYIYRLTGNKILCDLNYRTGLIVRLWQALHIGSQDVLKAGLEQHLTLLDCLERRDIRQALSVIHDHTTMSFGQDFKGTLLTPYDLLEGNYQSFLPT